MTVPRPPCQSLSTHPRRVSGLISAWLLPGSGCLNRRKFECQGQGSYASRPAEHRFGTPGPNAAPTIPNPPGFTITTTAPICPRHVRFPTQHRSKALFFDALFPPWIILTQTLASCSYAALHKRTLTRTFVHGQWTGPMVCGMEIEQFTTPVDAVHRV